MNKPIRYEIFDVHGRLHSNGLLGLEVDEETRAGDIKGMLSVMHLGPGDPIVEVFGRSGLLAADELVSSKLINIKIKRAQ